ncbi:MAG: hypothetical protein PHU64_02255 [Candidatus Omnitrophica bacterium]|nr:hypothetical protein [Candidatus Omnitrophota bacterium]
MAVLAASGKDGVISKAVTKMFNDSADLIEDQSTEFLSRAAGGVSTDSSDGTTGTNDGG